MSVVPPVVQVVGLGAVLVVAEAEVVGPEVDVERPVEGLAVAGETPRRRTAGARRVGRPGQPRGAPQVGPFGPVKGHVVAVGPVGPVGPPRGPVTSLPEPQPVPEVHVSVKGPVGRGAAGGVVSEASAPPLSKVRRRW